MSDLVPQLPWGQPELNHTKRAPYIDYPLVYNATVTEEAFYVEYPFTIATSDITATRLFKWTGNGWQELFDVPYPCKVDLRGFFAVTTSTDEYVSITEHVYL